MPDESGIPLAFKDRIRAAIEQRLRVRLNVTRTHEQLTALELEINPSMSQERALELINDRELILHLDRKNNWIQWSRLVARSKGMPTD